MLRIGMVGVNTYHAEAFTRIFNGGPDESPRIDGARITHVWPGEHSERLDELETMLGPYDVRVAGTADLIDAVDGVLILDDTDGGARHAALATPFLFAGMPVFVDKPMTTDYAEAAHLFEVAEQHNAPLFSSSALRFPVEIDRDAIAALGKLSSIVSIGPGEWFYYGVHAVEVVGAVTGDRPVSVHRFAMEEKDIAVVTYASGLASVIMTLRDAGYLFKVAVYGEHGSYTFSVDDGMGFYTNEMAAFVEMIRTGTPPVTPQQTLDVLAILHAGIRSAEEGRTVRIDEITGTAE